MYLYISYKFYIIIAAYYVILSEIYNNTIYITEDLQISSKKGKSTRENTTFITKMQFVTNMVNVWEILIKSSSKLTQN
jgi:hypothetical protein